jgi:Transcriptional regulator, AbiEi antitoxin
MSYDVPPPLRELAELQRGVVSWNQVLAAGLSPDVIRRRVGRGRWQRLHNGVYAVFTGPPDRQAELWAAVLRAGQGAALSYQTAAELDGLLDKASSVIHVTVPASRRVTAIKDVAVHSRLDVQRARHPARLPPRIRLEETVLDLSDTCSDVVSAIDWLARAMGRRLTTQAQLRLAVSQRKQLRWRADIAAVLSPELAGIHSGLEYRYFRYVEKPHALPAGRRQAPAIRGSRRAYRDVLYQDYGLIVELDGQVAHPGDTRWQDIRRDNAAVVDGVITLRYGYRDLAAIPCPVAAQVSDVLKLRGWLGAPRPCSPGCPVS